MSLDDVLGTVSYADHGLGRGGNGVTWEDSARWAEAEDAGLPGRGEARAASREFVREFRDASGVYVYREQLLRRHQRGERKLVVQMRHLAMFDEKLLEALQRQPNVYFPIFESGVREALRLAVVTDEAALLGSTSAALGDDTDASGGGTATDPSDANKPRPATLSGGDNNDDDDETLVPRFQVVLHSDQTPVPMRSLDSTDINRLVTLYGIVVSASRVRPRAKTVCIVCSACNNVKVMSLDAGDGTGAPAAPKRCWEPTCKGRGNPATLSILPDRGTYVDMQTLKLQEAPEAVPTGEMPRSVQLEVDRELVDAVTPGTRVAVTGISSVRANSSAVDKASASGEGRLTVRTPFLRVVGIQIITAEGAVMGAGGASGRAAVFTPAEEDECLRIARLPNVYQILAKSVAPSISGAYTEDIKRAIACLLMGGSRKRLPDGVKLRGDINVLLLGDPSTAKSQFLKFAEKVAPVGVYTSGKGSSAAGLTASVVRDSSGEFFLEGGAMVLADGGVVCIDEFDKMREQDRVAIHEAMEQQTISVAKAGITTILNSRTSVLAAANPVFGTYNDTKSAAENIDFLPTILSRFDMIFIVRDVRDEEKDKMIAKHVLGIHVGYVESRGSGGRLGFGAGGGGSAGALGTSTSLSSAVAASSSSSSSAAAWSGNAGDEAPLTELDLPTLKRFVAYCRSRCAPVLSPHAAEMLCNHYVSIREDHRRRRAEQPKDGSTVPITVRQLEALVRVSESLAKMQLAPEVAVHHVEEAIRLFKVSTLNAAQRGALPGDISSLGAEQIQEIRRVEEQLLRRVPIGTVVPTQRLVEDFVTKQGFSVFSVHKALHAMVARGEVEHLNQQRNVRRLR